MNTIDVGSYSLSVPVSAKPDTMFGAMGPTQVDITDSKIWTPASHSTRGMAAAPALRTCTMRCRRRASVFDPIAQKLAI